MTRKNPHRRCVGAAWAQILKKRPASLRLLSSPKPLECSAPEAARTSCRVAQQALLRRPPRLASTRNNSLNNGLDNLEAKLNFEEVSAKLNRRSSTTVDSISYKDEILDNPLAQLMQIRTQIRLQCDPRTDPSARPGLCCHPCCPEGAWLPLLQRFPAPTSR